MIRLISRPAFHALPLFGLLAGLAVAEAARADDSTIAGCRAEDQSTELVTDCDDKTQQAEFNVPAPPPPITPPDVIYLKVPGEGGKGDHDRDRGMGGDGGDGGNGGGGKGAGGRPI